ncbi:hypothetical protein DSAG12_03345 [Promethearchaeum syntrophicum]|uniref:Uncharacterized protein n=1 Tax=Promethearchaeum syntrophicum TaxID=2594042 RepID=A0A5B9DE32_9ARCH|nr:hypothetical protein [Candidatus Prometheoarchaeum syntrophicum]QEE17508.1 hypothetical protein DSAG12_03345 [Candidatus Prometheoarchaeum syntrophicum]
MDIDNSVKSPFNLEKYNKKLLNAKNSKNLMKTRDILNTCTEMLNKQPQTFNPDLKTQLKALIEANEETIRKTTEELLGEIERVENSFNSKDFAKIPNELESIKSKVQVSGITELINNIKFLKKKTENSVHAQRNLERFAVPVPSGITSEDLELKFYSLTSLLNDIQKQRAAHPEIISKIEEVHKIYQNSMTEHGLTDLKKSLGKNLKLKAKDLSETRNIHKINKKFDDLLSSAKNTTDLLQAKDFLASAEAILKENDLKIIYQDKQEEYYIFLKKIDSMIEKWTSDTDLITKKSMDLMEEFQYSIARKNLVKLKEDLTKNGLVSLVNSVNIVINICQINEQIYNDVQAINGIFESKSYFNAHNKLESLKQHISTKYTSIEMVKSNKEQIDTLIDKIAEARRKEEAELKEEIEKIWIILSESLDFEVAKKELAAKRNFADLNGYPSIIVILDKYSAELDLNLQIFNLFNQLTKSLKEAKIHSVKLELVKINSNISEKSEIYFTIIKNKYSELEKETDNQISKEKTTIIQKIEDIEAIIDEKNNLISAQNAISEIKNRISETGLKEFSSLLEPITQKIELNLEGVKIQKEIQNKIAANQLKIGENEYTTLLEKMNSALEKTPKIYSSALKKDLENELNDLKTKIGEMTSKLHGEFNKLEEKINQTFDFSEAQDHLKKYTLRAKDLGLDDLIVSIENLNRKCSKNTEFVSEYNQLHENYENLIDFVTTVEAIYKLFDTCEKEEKSFDHVKAKIKNLHNRVKSESNKRESKVKNAFDKIIKTEVMTLKFKKAIDSLTENLTTAQNLNVTLIVPEIKHYINFCSINLPILENLDGIENDLKSGRIIEARNNISLVKPNLPRGKEKFEKIADNITSHWNNLHKSIETEIESEIEKLKGKIPSLVTLVENKKTNEAKSSLFAARNRAEYLGVGMTVAEINDLLKICDMQSSPDSIERQKKKKIKKIEPPIKKISPRKEKLADIEGTMIVKHTKPGPMKLRVSENETKSEHPNIQPRSHLRRSPKKAVQVCPYCKATQPSSHERYCFFCGKQL